MEARLQLKTCYSGFDWIIAEIIETFDGQAYNIGEISKSGKWTRDTYKMYNCLEDSSTTALYSSKWIERPRKELDYSKEKSSRLKELQLNTGFQSFAEQRLYVRLAIELAKQKVAAAE